MSSNFPSSLDSFNNPSSSDHLDDPLVLHSKQHTNINDSVNAIETWIGISGSIIPTTIEFRLHNTSSGHNHDGYNSAPAMLGPPNIGLGPSYPLGYFTDFTNTTRIGSAIDKINQAMLSITSGSSTVFKYNSTTLGLSGVINTINISGSSEGVVGYYSGSVATFYFSESLKEISRKLILLADGGPFEGYQTGAFRIYGYESNQTFITESIWYTDSLMTSKIVSEKITYGPKRTINTVQWKAYLNDGMTIASIVTDTIYYRGIFEISRSRSII